MGQLENLRELSIAQSTHGKKRKKTKQKKREKERKK